MNIRKQIRSGIFCALLITSFYCDCMWQACAALCISISADHFSPLELGCLSEKLLCKKGTRISAERSTNVRFLHFHHGGTCAKRYCIHIYEQQSYCIGDWWVPSDGRMAEVVGSVQSQGRTTCVSSEVGEYLHWKVKMIKYASDSWVRS